MIRPVPLAVLIGMAGEADLEATEQLRKAKARDQDLPANPMRISGACGRLMCCLKYDHPLYQDFKATAPAIGEDVDSPAGPGRVVAHSVPGDSVVIKLAADGSRQVCPKASVCGSRKAYESHHQPQAPPA